MTADRRRGRTLVDVLRGRVQSPQSLGSDTRRDTDVPGHVGVGTLSVLRFWWIRHLLWKIWTERLKDVGGPLLSACL